MRTLNAALPDAWRGATHHALEDRDSGDGRLHLVRRGIIFLILANGLAALLESNQSTQIRYLEFFAAFELFSVLAFSTEYVLRLWSIPEDPRYAGLAPWKARLRYACTPLALVDLLAILPFYLAAFIHVDLRYLRLFRLLRLLKLTHYFEGLEILTSVLRREAVTLLGAFVSTLVIIVVAASLMFALEHEAQPEKIPSVFQAVWWAVVTLGTVGYGDITPVTFGGKLLAMTIIVFGVCAIAIPSGLLAARFTEELQGRQALMRSRVAAALSDGQLDTEEVRAIEALREELGLSGEAVERIIALQRRNNGARLNFCPHCGTSLQRYS